MADGYGATDPTGMRRRLLLATIILVASPVAVLSTTSAGTTPNTYYVSPTGSDTNAGTASAPWKTIGRVNNAALSPGDTVLFQGGQTFSGASLMPAYSGTASAPIHFGSYGSGRAQLNVTTGQDVWIPDGRHDLSFDNLDFTGGSTLFASSATGSGTYDISVTNSVFHDTPLAAVNVANPSDHNWTLSGNTIRHTGDSGMFIWGSNVSVTNSTITDTGWNMSITWGKHGIYDKGPNTTIADDDFSNIPHGQALSLRFHGARVYGNTIHDTPYAIAFFDYDTSSVPQGTSYVYDNRLWNISGYGFYYASQADPQGNPPSVSFVVASNTFSFASSTEAVNLSEVPSVASVTMANNVFTGSYGSSYRGCGTCSEFNNDWYGGTSNVPSGSGDQRVNPALSAAPALAPGSSAPVVDAGTTRVTGLTYTANCDGAPLHYCGANPDQGAAEYLGGSATASAPSLSPAPTAKPAPTAPAPSTTAPAAQGSAGTKTGGTPSGGTPSGGTPSGGTPSKGAPTGNVGAGSSVHPTHARRAHRQHQLRARALRLRRLRQHHLFNPIDRYADIGVLHH